MQVLTRKGVYLGLRVQGTARTWEGRGYANTAGAGRQVPEQYKGQRPQRVGVLHVLLPNHKAV